MRPDNLDAVPVPNDVGLNLEQVQMELIGISCLDRGTNAGELSQRKFLRIGKRPAAATTVHRTGRPADPPGRRSRQRAPN